jgi:uncharacterized protein (DUF488 family)
MTPLTTIGYERATLDGLVDSLAEARVGLLIDVRAIAASRRPGFAKSQLAAGVTARGIGYHHLRALGTPAPGREAARAGRHAELRAIVEAHLAGIEAQAALAEVAALARAGARVCLLCLEADPARCHRSIVAEHLARATGCAVRHLTV